MVAILVVEERQSTATRRRRRSHEVRHDASFARCTTRDSRVMLATYSDRELRYC